MLILAPKIISRQKMNRELVGKSSIDYENEELNSVRIHHIVDTCQNSCVLLTVG